MKKLLYLILLTCIIGCTTPEKKETNKVVNSDTGEPFKNLPPGRNFRTKEEIAARMKYFEEEERRKSPYYGESKEDSIIRVKEEAKWRKTKAGKIFLKHPEWTKDDCERLVKGRIWIGMKYAMLVYTRGLPNSANPSNYGRGNQWQWCWTEYSPSCFYDRDDDGNIDSYN